MNEMIEEACHVAALIELRVKEKKNVDKSFFVEVFNEFVLVLGASCSGAQVIVSVSHTTWEMRYGETVECIEYWKLSCPPDHFYIQDILHT